MSLSYLEALDHFLLVAIGCDFWEERSTLPKYGCFILRILVNIMFSGRWHTTPCNKAIYLYIWMLYCHVSQERASIGYHSLKFGQSPKKTCSCRFQHQEKTFLLVSRSKLCQQVRKWWSTLPKTSSAPLQMGRNQKDAGSSSNHHFFRSKLLLLGVQEPHVPQQSSFVCLFWDPHDSSIPRFQTASFNLAPETSKKLCIFD